MSKPSESVLDNIFLYLVLPIAYHVYYHFGLDPLYDHKFNATYVFS
jgi:hypothetical protein